jgi:hypothetical protein
VALSTFLSSCNISARVTVPHLWVRYYNSGPPLRSRGQSSWLQIERRGFDSLRYQIFWEVVGLERSPLSLVSTTEELLERKSRGSGLEIRAYGSRGSAALTTRYPSNPQILALTSPTIGCRWVGIVCSRTHVPEFVCVITLCFPVICILFSYLPHF